ncbi:MAG: hypothetical protein BRD23_02805 [Halobacteriales archaeon SW_9_67_25]|jgi:hypothetical protein|nr:MAG: hypothetical protein BRD23_02805 [Halobacteriales archaeon SW_9_67_25]
MDPHHKASGLWGVIGGLSFLVLVQGYELAVGTRLGMTVKAGVALVVAALAAVLTHLARPRIDGNERS